MTVSLRQHMGLPHWLQQNEDLADIPRHIHTLSHISICIYMFRNGTARPGALKYTDYNTNVGDRLDHGKNCRALLGALRCNGSSTAEYETRDFRSVSDRSVTSDSSSILKFALYRLVFNPHLVVPHFRHRSFQSSMATIPISG